MGAGHEPAALVGVEDLRPTDPRQRLPQVATQNDASSVFDSRRNSTAGLAASINAPP